MMPRGRNPDPEGLRTVLLVCATLIAVGGLGLAVVLRGWAILAGLFLIAFAVGCVRIALDDGRGSWCEACVSRNPEDAEACEHCGASLA